MFDTLAEQQITQFANALPDAVVALDSAGHMQWWNTQAGILLGLSAQQKGVLIRDFLDNDLLDKCLSSSSHETVEAKAPGNKNLLLAFSVKAFGSDEYLLIAKDVTQIHRLEKMRRDFIANVSHELRTPLTVIKGYLETLLDNDVADKDIQQHMFSQMQQQSARMERLVADLLLLSRLETNDPETSEHHPINMNEMLQQLLADTRLLSAERQHHVSINVKTDIKVFGNYKELYSAFSNLAFNAVHYTPAEGSVELNFYEDDKHLYFSVIDTGPGIEAKHIPRLTERFYRADRGRSREGGGTGLGLAIVKHVLLRHGASLKITSQLGMGSEFCCIFAKNP